ncbi:MAG: ATP-binding protein, partial [Gemmatimonadota bacterium]|nr:ATP-binding protein [Gemmatimonadota bacterium]
HSNACFDIPGVNIYHCTLINGHTQCQLVDTDFEKADILSDLGYKHSDLLQSNFIIWVEGPSDRIYLNHWIQGKDATLVEGLHYSIMFYGGRLLSHLSYDDPEVDEFIKLCRINRNASIIMDSDREASGQVINHTKIRVKKDFEDNNCFVWVTQGREIENYVEPSILYESVLSVHPKTVRKMKWNQYRVMTKLKGGSYIDKVAVAKKVATHDQDYSTLDLNSQINRLINFILKANS